ncbi:MAG TPA: alpha/beta fold hydrolase [Granulicella sp.]|jgi:haloalkane dehalogenase
MVPAHETFDGTFPFSPHFSSASGFRMHYVDEGHGEDTVLMLHGEPTWGYLFREVIPMLSAEHRVIVPDHMGFGKSETPSDREYSLGEHISNLERFVLSLDLRNLTLVMHDFGGPMGIGFALRHPDRIRRLIATNAPLPLGLPSQGELVTKNLEEAPWFQWINRTYKEGSLKQTLGDLSYNLLSTLWLNGLSRTQSIDDTWLRAYSAPFSTPEECAGAIGWAWGVGSGSLRFEEGTTDAVEQLSKKPATAIWGMRDPTLMAKHLLPLFQEAFPDAPISRIASASHYLYEDAPEAVGLLIQQFIKLTGSVREKAV